jgi:hypothetical protein
MQCKATVSMFLILGGLPPALAAPAHAGHRADRWRFAVAAVDTPKPGAGQVLIRSTPRA